MYFEIDDYNALAAALHEMCVDFLREEVPEESVFESKLVACELVSNALRHGGGRAFFRASLEEDVIRLNVQGAVAYRPPERCECSEVDAETGRGLYLVESFCESRDYDEREGIRVVIRIRK